MHASSAPTKKGFTLIELLVVVAIIGLLASIIGVSLISAQKKGRDAKRISDIKNIQLALDEYYNDNNSYPLTLSALAPTYMPSEPLDPIDNSTHYKYVTWNSSNSQICGSSNPAIGYHLGAALEDSTNTALAQDRDAAARTPATTNCGSTADFNGNSSTVSNACSTTGGTETCYDVTNN